MLHRYEVFHERKKLRTSQFFQKTGRFLDVFALLEAFPHLGELWLKPYCQQFAAGERWTLADYVHAHFEHYTRMRMTEE